MSDEEVKGLPVKGYKPTQSVANIALVDRVKETEELVLRMIDQVQTYIDNMPGQFDGRMLSTGRTQIQLGFMAVVRSVFNPGRIRLPEDEK